ncbi:MAG: hypothetical protein PHY99_05630 [Bacteroidales bacterium]|nr:hypothetical protein [Bacteroidales bacterium]
MTSERFNNLWIGIATGILVPFMTLTCYYFARYSKLSVAEFITVYKSLGILTHIISLSVLPDLLLFFLFIRRDYLKSARGVLLATFLFTFTVLLLRFL